MQKPKFFRKLLPLFLLAIVASCNKKTNDIEIKGQIKGLDATWVYLYKTYPVGKKPPLDSVRVTNGSFTFKFHPDTVFQPNLVSIGYKNSKGKAGGLAIINPNSKNKNKPDLYADFPMETGITELTGDLSKSQGITLKGGPQNKFYFANIDLPFREISYDPAIHKMQVDNLVKKIQAMPNAFWAMFAMQNFQFVLSNQEIEKILNTFDKETRAGYRGQKLQRFLNYRLEAKDLKANSTLLGTDNLNALMIDTTKKLNMVVFWASWCGPCREEIPSLKKLAVNITDKRFRMVGVSIDRDTSEWHTALIEEKMSWQQLCITKNEREKLTAQYNLNYIPQVYLIDNKRKLVADGTSIDVLKTAELTKLINNYLAKK